MKQPTRKQPRSSPAMSNTVLGKTPKVVFEPTLKPPSETATATTSDPAAQMADGSEVRCECHRLLARCRRGEIALRCPRCKKSAVFSVVSAQTDEGINVEFVFHIS